MKEFIHRWLSRFFRFTFVGLMIGLLVGVALILIRPLIYNYYSWRVERHLISDFHKNREKLDDLVQFAKQLNTLEHFEVISKDKFSFRVYDSLFDRMNKQEYDNISIIDLDENNYFRIDSLKIKDNIVLLFRSDTTRVYRKNWSIWFTGPLTHPLIKPLLAYNAISIKQIRLLTAKLNALQIKYFNMTKDCISLRYAGDSLDHFNYIILLDQDTPYNKVELNHLADNYYWYLFRDEFFHRGYYDWTKVYPLKKD